MNLLDAKDVIARHQRSVPVRMVPLAKDLGFEVYTISNWPESVSGMIKKDGERGGTSGYAIYVNANHPPKRRRFTIAHEIAHGLLHDQLIGDGVQDDALYRTGLSNTVEAQANRFAADLLMPWPLLSAEMRKGIETVPDLAERFEVSKSAMSIRLGVPFEV